MFDVCAAKLFNCVNLFINPVDQKLFSHIVRHEIGNEFEKQNGKVVSMNVQRRKVCK